VGQAAALEATDLGLVLDRSDRLQPGSLIRRISFSLSPPALSTPWKVMVWLPPVLENELVV
jgi:hypothetical protein